MWILLTVILVSFVGFCLYVHIHTADAVNAAKELMRDELKELEGE